MLAALQARLDELAKAHAAPPVATSSEGGDKEEDPWVAALAARMTRAKEALPSAATPAEMRRTIRWWVTAAAGVLVLIGVVVLWQVAFDRWFNESYVGWYLSNGALISVLLALMSSTNDLNTNHGLISSHPFHYVAGTTLMFAVVSLSGRALAGRRASLPVLSRVFMTSRHNKPAVRAYAWVRWVIEATAFALSVGMMVIFMVAMWVVQASWLLFVVPLQYFVTLVCGAPARFALQSDERAWVERHPTDSGGTRVSLTYGSRANMPKEATESGWTAKPVTFTAVVSAAVLLLLSRVLAW